MIGWKRTWSSRASRARPARTTCFALAILWRTSGGRQRISARKTSANFSWRLCRYRHKRHSTASLLLMKGADLAAVQKIMRHQDPRITTEVYGHLQTTYLKGADRAPPASGPSRRTRVAAVGPLERPTSSRAGSRRVARRSRRHPPTAEPRCASRLHLLPIYYPTPKRPMHRRLDAEPLESDPADLNLSGREDLNLRPFGSEFPELPSQQARAVHKLA